MILRKALVVAVILIAGCDDQFVNLNGDHQLVSGDMTPDQLASIDMAGDARACSSSAGGDDDGGVTNNCQIPPVIDGDKCSKGDIATYCGTTTCRSYGDEVASLRQMTSCGVVRIGTCDSLRFIEIQGLGLGYKLLRFYDSCGNIVFAEIGSDANQYCNQSSFSEHYGTAPTCQMRTTQTVCYNGNWIC